MNASNTDRSWLAKNQSPLANASSGELKNRTVP